ncbi:phosphoglycerate dehydrogenase [Nonomuraea sp. NPDC046802]|uniref:phosphoglycerate dehydrogenase n=1 Tax=Nonomuraea sp. NPDC046802 TaxID=3154919 RepID=UPI0033C2A0CC
MRVLVTTPTFAKHSQEPLRVLREGGCVVEHGGLEHVDGADAVIVGLDAVTADVIGAGRGLRVIAKHGVGVDTIDVEAARSRGIPVVYAPGSNSRAVAELAFGLMLAAARKIAQSDAAIRAGGWPKLFGPELAGKTLAIIGYGRIGRLVAGYARAFGMTVVVHDPYATLGGEVRAAGLAECLAEADYVSLHLPATPGAPPLLGRAELESMKPGAILVNTSRGGLVDEEALAELLHAGRLGGVALDAFADEPPSAGSPLRDAPNTVMSAHIGACTYEANRDMGVMVAQDVLRVLRGETPMNEWKSA